MAISKAASDKGFGDSRYRSLVNMLVDARKAHGLSQDALGKLLGRHQQFVSRYELGERRLDVVEFIDVSRTLHLDPADIVNKTPAS